MDWFKADWFKALETLPWQLTAGVPVIALAMIIFHRQIAEAIARITSIEIDPKRRRWKVSFGQRIQQEQKRATGISRQMTTGRALPIPTPAASGKQTGRAMVLEALGALKQVVYDGCIANDIPIAPTLGVQEAARRLGDARGLSIDLIRSIELVYELGREVAGDSRLRPEDDDARAYWSLAHNVAQLIGVGVLVPLKESTPVAPPPQRRATMVGGNFGRPGPGNPTGALVGVGGALRGQRFSIDKPNYRIGRNPSNDLSIPADDSVSGDHAYLRYEKGGLFLSDQGSLNGTFLNEQRVTGVPLMVRLGDRIRLGESVFEVVGAASHSRSGEAKEGGIKTPSGQTAVP